MYPELSTILRRFFSASSASAGLDSREVGGFGGGGGFIRPDDGSVSVSLSPSGTFSGSADLSFCFCASDSSLALAERSSPTNQLIDHHKPPHIKDRTMKWTLYVASRRQSSSNCKHAKEAFVATSSVGVGPGVKMLLQSSSRKDAMPRGDNGRRNISALQPATAMSLDLLNGCCRDSESDRED